MYYLENIKIYLSINQYIITISRIIFLMGDGDGIRRMHNKQEDTKYMHNQRELL